MITSLMSFAYEIKYICLTVFAWWDTLFRYESSEVGGREQAHEIIVFEEHLEVFVCAIQEKVNIIEQNIFQLSERMNHPAPQLSNRPLR